MLLRAGERGRQAAVVGQCRREGQCVPAVTAAQISWSDRRAEPAAQAVDNGPQGLHDVARPPIAPDLVDEVVVRDRSTGAGRQHREHLALTI
jgi:hypothetical protein